MQSVAVRTATTQTGFWAMPTRAPGKVWRPVWDRLVDQVRLSDSLTLYRAVEEGVPAVTVEFISRALSESALGVLGIIGLPETTYRRKIEAGETLPDAAGHRAVALIRVAAKLRQLLAESGDPAEVAKFDLDGWVSSWIKEPLPELGGETPAALLRNPDGQRVIDTLLERMRGGLAA